MASWFLNTTLLFLALSAATAVSSTNEQIQAARNGVLEAIHWAEGMERSFLYDLDDGSSYNGCSVAIGDCLKLYEEAEPLLARLVSSTENYSRDDAVAWLSAAVASHRSCLDGLDEKEAQSGGRNLTLLLSQALSSVKQQEHFGTSLSYGASRMSEDDEFWGILKSWDPSKSQADVVVAQDGSGHHTSINEAVAALAKLGYNSNKRGGRAAIIHVKSGVYNEKVEIDRNLENLMFVGDGIDETVVTGANNVRDGASTMGSASFGVSGNGFWARDMTFENTAGPGKHQAVALRVASDLSVFYRCSFKGYQDTLLVHSLRQFYRDCHIYGTQDFIFGDAAAVFQNCDIFARKPMDHQSNLITAQGRDDPKQSTGISILNSRVSPASDLSPVVGKFETYLGRPWKRYSRTVFMKTDLGGLIHPRGWREWRGDLGLKTLYYAEYMNRGPGASTEKRVKWPGFHVLMDYGEASQFSVRNFIQGDQWIPATGVPYWPDV